MRKLDLIQLIQTKIQMKSTKQKEIKKGKDKAYVFFFIKYNFLTISVNAFLSIYSTQLETENSKVDDGTSSTIVVDGGTKYYVNLTLL